MATEAMINTITNLFDKYCPLGDSLLHEFMSRFLIYLRGAKHPNHRCHFCATSPDDFTTNRLGKIIEAVSPNTSVMTFSDLSLRSGTNQENEAGTMIIYLDKKPRHSEEYERLCQLMRDRYFNNHKAIVVIIGNGAFVDRKLKHLTIHLYVPPFTTHVPGFFLSEVEVEIKQIRQLIDEFWKKQLSDILNRYNTFPRLDWLKNQDEQSWLPILVPSKVYSDDLRQPILYENMLALAKKMVTSRKMEESAIPLEQKVLEATLTFVEQKKSLKRKKSNSEAHFYYGPDFFEFVKTMLLEPELRKEKISEILNDHHIVIDTWRPRFKEGEIEEEESPQDVKKSTKKKKDDKIIQPVCYAFDKDQLSNALKAYLEGVDHGGKKPRLT